MVGGAARSASGLEAKPDAKRLRHWGSRFKASVRWRGRVMARAVCGECRGEPPTAPKGNVAAEGRCAGFDMGFRSCTSVAAACGFEVFMASWPAREIWLASLM
jgi:hypothetical protein